MIRGSWKRAVHFFAKVGGAVSKDLFLHKIFTQPKFLKNKIPLNPPLAKGESELASRGICHT
jgi:hypothetical protein